MPAQPTGRRNRRQVDNALQPPPQAAVYTPTFKESYVETVGPVIVLELYGTDGETPIPTGDWVFDIATGITLGGHPMSSATNSPTELLLSFATADPGDPGDLIIPAWDGGVRGPNGEWLAGTRLRPLPAVGPMWVKPGGATVDGNMLELAFADPNGSDTDVVVTGIPPITVNGVLPIGAEVVDGILILEFAAPVPAGGLVSIPAFCDNLEGTGGEKTGAQKWVLP